MKTDLVLTTDEYLNACCAAPRVKPPARDARHVPVTTENDIDLHPKKRGCRCDRWLIPALTALTMKSEVNKMEYVIAFAVVAMMGLSV